MKFYNGCKIVSSGFALIFALAVFGCQQQQAARSPTEAYKALYAAVKAKDTAKIKALMSKNSLGLAEFAAQKNNQSQEKWLENGFQETTFAETLPPMRDERIKGTFGAVEVYNEKRKAWDDTVFVLEDGSWKLAVGDQFKGTYQSPGKGRAQLEAEANNSMNDVNALPPPANGGFPAGNASNANVPANKKVKVETAEVPIENANAKPAGKEKK